MKRLTAAAPALIAMLVVAVGSASAESTGTISIGSVEGVDQFEVNVTGTGACAIEEQVLYFVSTFVEETFSGSGILG
jgi:hypothetical protein